jgi:D-proline reductase (dithiol) PrdB
MTVDSFKYLSRLVSRYYKLASVDNPGPIPWTPLAKPLEAACFSLVTSGGLYHKGYEPPFDLEGEEQNPSWGDPSFRSLPADIPQDELGASHHHINTDGVLADINVLLPVDHFRELVDKGEAGGLARTVYSFMGYQGFPADLTAWKQDYGPQVAEKMTAEGVECVLLTTA